MQHGKTDNALVGAKASFNQNLLGVNYLVVSVGRRSICEKMSVVTRLLDESCVALILGMPFLALIRNLCQPLFQACLLAVLAGAGDGVEAHTYGDRSHGDEKGRLDQLVSIIVPRVISFSGPTQQSSSCARGVSGEGRRTPSGSSTGGAW